MEKCTIHKLKIRTLQESTRCESKGIQRVVVRLLDLADFDKPVIKKCRWGDRISAVILHITPANVTHFLEIDNHFSFNFLTLYGITWVLAARDRAFRLNIALAYASAKNNCPFEVEWTLDFIEFGDEALCPESVKNLAKSLERYGPAVYGALHESYPNYSLKKPETKSFWILFESDLDPKLAYSEAVPTWLDNGDNLLGIPAIYPSEWMNYVVLCFSFIARMHPEFGIVLKRVNNHGKQLVFFAPSGDLYYILLLFHVLKNIPNNVKNGERSGEGGSSRFTTVIEKTVSALAMVPYVGNNTLHMFRLALQNFKNGQPINGTLYLVGGIASGVVDGAKIGHSIYSNVSKPSPKVAANCKKIRQFTSKAETFASYTTTACSAAGKINLDFTKTSNKVQAPKSQSRKTRLELTDEGLFLLVFPRLADYI